MMRCGFSDSSAESQGYVQAVYAQLVTLQARREPFNVYTGKRHYQNMLINSLMTVTDEKSEWTLFINVAMREIIITSTQSTSSSMSSKDKLDAAGVGTLQTTTDNTPLKSTGGANLWSGASSIPGVTPTFDQTLGLNVGTPTGTIGANGFTTYTPLTPAK
jgi:hypothetical protein